MGWDQIHDLAGRYGRLLSRDYVDGDGNGDDHRGRNAGPHQMAGAFGKRLAACCVVQLSGFFLMEQTHRALILSSGAWCGL